MRITTTRLAAVAAVALALIISGCSSGSSRTTATSAPSGAQAQPTTGASPTSQAAPATTTGGAAEVNPAGDIPDNQVYVPYTPPGAHFTVKVPEGWARTSSGGVVVFSDKLNSVRLESVPAPVAPTVASATRYELPAIQRASRNFQPGTVTAVRRAAGTAVLITYRADAPPDPVTGKVVRDAVERYEFWDAATRTEAVVTLSGPVGADNVDPWRTVTDSLRWR
jgi:hypothetical protein